MSETRWSGQQREHGPLQALLRCHGEDSKQCVVYICIERATVHGCESPGGSWAMLFDEVFSNRSVLSADTWKRHDIVGKLKAK